MRLAARVFLACVLGCTALACAGPQPPPPEFQVAPKEGAYVIGASDVLRVDVWQNDRLSLQAVPVRPDGKITMLLIDDVQAAGLTTDELKAVIAQELSEFIENPTVTVVLIAPNSKRAYVLGQVLRPGAVPLNSDTRVLEAITASGGFTVFADKADVRVIRQIGERELEYRFDYDAYVDGDAPGTNVLLHPGDTVLVP